VLLRRLFSIGDSRNKLSRSIPVQPTNFACQSANVSFLNCCLLNARSVCNKLVELQHFLNSSNIDTLLITETWLSSSYSSSLLTDLSNFSVLRKDRLSTAGGVCVCAIIRSGIDFVLVDVMPEFNDLELLVFDVLGVHTKYRFILCYRPPSSGIDDLCLLTKAIDCLCISDASVILCGDFNLPQINWSSQDTSNVSDLLSSSFVDCIQENALVQYVVEATRGNNILDLVFSNDPFLMHDVIVGVPLSTSDHNTVDFKLNFCNAIFLNNTDKVFTDFSAVDWDSFNEYLCNINWSDVYSVDDDGDQRCSAFSSTLNNATSQFAPTSIKHVRKSAVHSYPHHIRKLISKKAFLWKKAKTFKTKQLHKSYRECASAVRRAIYAHTCQIEAKLIDSSNIGSFYRYVNKKLSSRCGVGCLKRDDGSVTNDPKEKAEL
jgi:hypothetical protein